MTRYLVVLSLCLISCRDGQDGERGPMGPQGAQGNPGPRGTQGPVGETGMQGPMGFTGPQGVPGIPAKSLTIWSADGGELGPMVSNGTNNLQSVYLKDEGCIAQLDWNTNSIHSLQTRIYYTQTNCTGIAFMELTAPLFPLTCMISGEIGFKVQQPVMVQQFTATSNYGPWAVSADGGVEAKCTNSTVTSNGAIVLQDNTVAIQGPFSFWSN